MRASGILMHITSLPSKHGIGTLGKEAYNFVDFLYESGQKFWQILPIGPTGYGDSPYQSFSAFAGNPYFIDLDLLCRDGLLKKDEYEDLDFGDNPNQVDFEKIYRVKKPLVELAAKRLASTPEYELFCNENSYWLDSYALYTVIKKSLGEIAISDWPSSVITYNSNDIPTYRKNHSDEIEVIKKIQYLFITQWKRLKEYANNKGIKIIGDMPIYVSADSADIFAFSDLFMLDAQKKPTSVAGCPPDAFSEDGQLWGNPLYNWDLMEKDGFEWWCKRLEHSSKLFDVIRIDHFRGFEAFYCIPYGAENAKNGKWKKGPGMKLFKALKQNIGNVDIIAEDLGTITAPVRKLLKSSGFPGMKVLQFAFAPGADSEYLPHHHIENCVLYTGTHDNDTTRGWLENASEEEFEYAKGYMRLSDSEGLVWGVIKTAMQSPAMLCVIPMQDFINADSDARMNTPSTMGGNWTWRIGEGEINTWLANIINEVTKTFGR